MAFQSGNADRPFGFIAVRHYFGGLVRASAYSIASGLAQDLFYGDPVKSTGTGKNITIAAAAGRALGVFAGVQYVDSNGDVRWEPKWVSGTVIETGSKVVAWVYDDPGILFEIQADGAVVAADIGATADYVLGAGDAKTGRSRYELDSSDIGTGANLKIIELVDRPDNAFGTNAKVHVLINEHELKSDMTAV